MKKMLLTFLFITMSLNVGARELVKYECDDETYQLVVVEFSGRTPTALYYDLPTEAGMSPQDAVSELNLLVSHDKKTAIFTLLHDIHCKKLN